MSALPFFKKKKEEPKKAREAELQAKEGASERSSASASAPLQDMSAVGVLMRPHVTEKAGMAAEKNEYVFEVYPTANKKDVKHAVEKTYKVQVVSVNMVNMPAKTKRVGKRLGKTRAIRKAIVRIQKGQTLDILPR